MKMSVSIPDELWEDARSKRPDLNQSRLVQEALEAFRASRTSPGFSTERPADARPAFEKARDLLVADARKQFEDGYRAALEAAPDLEWWCLEKLAKGHFDVRRWTEDLGQLRETAELGAIPWVWAPSDKVFGALIRSLGALPEPDVSELFMPQWPYLRGYAVAMRDLWTEVVEGLPSGGEADHPASDEERPDLSRPREMVVVEPGTEEAPVDQ